MGTRGRKTNRKPETERNPSPAPSRAGAARKRRRRRRLRLGMAVLVLMACIVFVVLSLTVLFRVERFTAGGDLSMYSAEKVIEVADLPLDENLFLTDTKSAEERIEKQLPYVEKAKVTRRLPDCIHIDITMATPEFILVDDDSLEFYISDQGKTLGLAESEMAGLRITHAQASSLIPGLPAEYQREETASVIRQLLDALQKEAMFTNVIEIDLTDLYGIQLRYGDMYRIKIGTYADLNKKLEMAMYLIENELDPTQAGTIDVSANNQAIFRPDYDFGGTIIPPGEKAPSSGAAAQ